VAFTIDDGYFDHARVGAPVFAAYDWPVTIFATSGFLDGKTWLWWDRVNYVFTRTRRATLTVRLGSRRLTYSFDAPEARRRDAMALNLLCQDASQQDRLDCIAAVAREADVEVPAAPTPEYAPMTWDEARRLELQGVTLAPHTVSHPVLSGLTDGESAREIEESWARLRAELRNPAPVFSYPHGCTRDYGPRELETVERLGLLGAVGGHYEALRPNVHSAGPELWRVPRCTFHDDLLSVLQYVSGVSSVKVRIRRSLA
jgi:peptidoglycan/xylan/chitin deacetylase (PgdA/CDA1 family)